MRGPCLLGMILALVFIASLRGLAEENEREETTQVQDRPETRAKGGRLAAPPRSGKDSKDKRRPAVPLELPAEIEEGTAEGLSLDDALQRMLTASRDLAVKYQEIPKARADVLSAGLIENPAMFLNSEGVPYGNYSEQRPGETAYGPTVIFPPLDLTGKRRKRIRVARSAEKVLEAMYQDAVRLESDKVYSAYVDVLEAEIRRNALRQAAARMRGLADRGAQAAETGGTRARRAYAEIALREAETNLLQARHGLALLLAIPAEQADDLPLRGSLRDRAPSPPPTEELISLALGTRPDLAAYRLSVDRAQASVKLSRAEAWDDMLTFYTPYQATTFPSQGKKTATSWEAGGLAVLPIFERNQGDIARSRAEVSQLQIQVRGLMDQVINEVQRAASTYALSRQLVQKYENAILPSARRLREEMQHRFDAGQATSDAFLAAEQRYNEAAQRYLEALVNHRRSMLRLNTAVGQRILP